MFSVNKNSKQAASSQYICNDLGIRQITRLPEKVSPPDRGGES